MRLRDRTPGAPHGVWMLVPPDETQEMPLHGRNRIDRRVVESPLCLVARDIATRAGIRQGLVLAPEHEHESPTRRFGSATGPPDSSNPFGGGALSFPVEGSSRTWYCELVKNITVSVDNEIYRRARIKAAEASTSVSALVRQFLESLSGDESDFDRRTRLQAETLAGIRRFRAADRVSRDEAHDRRALP